MYNVSNCLGVQKRIVDSTSINIVKTQLQPHALSKEYKKQMYACALATSNSNFKKKIDTKSNNYEEIKKSNF
jgi:hypothetical protein